MPNSIRFLLNHQEVRYDGFGGRPVLDLLREDRRLTGTKEGCREGDCGACTVLVGDLRPDGKVGYRPMTSCLMPVAELEGRHLVSIEGLNGDGLNPIQEAIVDLGATQCGFCTPGIVVSLTGCLLAPAEQDRQVPDDSEFKAALSGHLCRCTGYRSLKDVRGVLAESPTVPRGLAAMVERGALPRYFLQVAERLEGFGQATPSPRPAAQAPWVAGGTDLYVQEGEKLPGGPVAALNRHEEWKGITSDPEWIRVGALTTFEEFARHPAIQGIYPGIVDYMFLIASLQIRVRATVGGNIVNASPIGDLTILLLALDAQLVLEEEGQEGRSLALRKFFKGYKDLAKTPSEALTEIRIPRPQPGLFVDCEKVSKRRCLDISSVNSALTLRLDGGAISQVSWAVGGVAPVPFLMRSTVEFLLGKTPSRQVLDGATQVAMDEVAPISDIRGSADYKRLLTRQFLRAHFLKLGLQGLTAEELL